jgi:hypothetical protein
VVRQLPLFQPPIDPGLLVRARAAGVDIGAALSDINTPLPHYRFQVILQKAVEFGNEVRNLGGALLAALEKQDAEQVSLLRAEKETQLLGSVRSAREAQLKEAKENIAALERSQAIVQERLEYYSQLKKRSDKENQNLDRLSDSERKRKKAGGAEVTASILHVIPNVSFGTGASSSFGGSNLGSASNATAGVFRNESAAFA